MSTRNNRKLKHFQVESLGPHHHAKLPLHDHCSLCSPNLYSESLYLFNLWCIFFFTQEIFSWTSGTQSIKLLEILAQTKATTWRLLMWKQRECREEALWPSLGNSWGHACQQPNARGISHQCRSSSSSWRKP